MSETVDQSVREKILTAITTSAEQAFETMLFTSLSHNGYEPLIEEDEPHGAISGSISLTGTVTESEKAVSCGVTLMFEKNVAEAFFRAMMMMGDDEPVVEAELKDAIGELANMVGGGAKSALQDQGIALTIGLPTTVVGQNHNISGPRNAARFSLVPQSDKGAFTIAVVLCQM